MVVCFRMVWWRRGEGIGGRIILKVELFRFFDRLDVESERKREVKDDFKVFGLNIWKN